MITNNFEARHIGPRANEMALMLKKVNADSLDQLIDQTIPQALRLEAPLNLPDGMNEYEYIQHLKSLGAKNKIFRTYIGMGYYNTITPAVIQRNMLENPGWYTAYTPYQAEISQGRLEALLNFQTMVSDLTSMPLSNCSLLDEGTSAAEAMIMSYNARSRAMAKENVVRYFVDEEIFAQTKAVLETRANPLGIELVYGDFQTFEYGDDFFGAIVQYPNDKGEVKDYEKFAESIHAKEGVLTVVADLMSLVLLTPPGEWGADVVVGSTQRFGIPMGYGGPHAGFLASSEKFKRNMPGRIIGVSKDAQGRPALRMALQTREQHIKREKATSNICTAQALLASMAAMYAVYHGPKGIKDIAADIHQNAVALESGLCSLGYKQTNEVYFDTLHIEGIEDIDAIRELALEREINFRYFEKAIGISIDETTSLDDLNDILEIFALLREDNESIAMDEEVAESIIPTAFQRKSDFLTHPVFNSYHSETEMMRYLKKLEIKDLALNRSMIPLGSCTMKLNPAVSLFSLSWPEFGAIHPFVPIDQVEGYQELILNLESDLCEITGFSAMSFQPNSGASGEYTGLLVIRAYHHSKGDFNRTVCLIPSSAHGTNPASAVMAGFDVVVVKANEKGEIDMDDLKAKAELHQAKLGALMITYPSTHGVFEASVLEIMDIIHHYGGQVYMDGANMNAQVGLTNPGRIGADVCHLNLHKTFAIPHGGGGPGVGPIGVAEHLTQFLPGNPVVKTGGEQAISAVSSAAFGSPSVLPISYAYIKLLGGEGLENATKMAILNANYLKDSIKEDFPILYTGANNRVAHEMILDCNKFAQTAGLQVIDIAKRLMDYGFHAPTVAFPVHGTLMVEPTESEPLSELNRFIDAMHAIREEIRAIENGEADKVNNIIKNAPHTADLIASDEWAYPYSRKEAAFPRSWSSDDKYWPPVGKVDDAYGDRNLFCTCAPVESYDEKLSIATLK
ncbi:MAG: aminomethyl-transferring glycine dehydrogenase [Bacteroidales bacterium]|nr:aminomethyl-transferring glycine dehydrogenase [Bacteroidales bacterium]